MKNFRRNECHFFKFNVTLLFIERLRAGLFWGVRSGIRPTLIYLTEEESEVMMAFNHLASCVEAIDLTAGMTAEAAAQNGYSGDVIAS